VAGEVPPTVLSPSVVEVEGQLQSFEVLHEHLSLNDGALGDCHILLQHEFILESLSLNGVIGKHFFILNIRPVHNQGRECRQGRVLLLEVLPQQRDENKLEVESLLRSWQLVAV
jgi:hypothetical protein